MIISLIHFSTAGSQTSWHSIQTCPTSVLVSVHLIVFVGSVQPKILSTKAIVTVNTSESEVCARVLSLEKHYATGVFHFQMCCHRSAVPKGVIEKMSSYLSKSQS